jgi:hypothetical protein
MSHDAVVVRPLCESLCPSWQPVDFQLHWQSAPVGKCVKGKRTNKPNSISGMWVRRLGKT